jgi:hypothetical protein
VVGNPQPIGNIYGSADFDDHGSTCAMLCPDGTSGCSCPGP